MNCVTPDKRLLSAADFVRQGAVLADIGTDHAFLPVFLCETGKISRAYAADVNEGPLRRAGKTVAEHGLEDKITLVLTDGLAGLAGKGITDVAVCGMGGELISSILATAKDFHTPGIRFILQPMTRAERLREYLSQSGFTIKEEAVSKAAGKIYFCFLCVYTGETRSLSAMEKTFGAYNLAYRKNDPLFLSYVRQKKKALDKKINGLSQSGKDAAEENDLLRQVNALLEEAEKERNPV